MGSLLSFIPEYTVNLHHAVKGDRGIDGGEVNEPIAVDRAGAFKLILALANLTYGQVLEPRWRIEIAADGTLHLWP